MLNDTRSSWVQKLLIIVMVGFFATTSFLSFFNIFHKNRGDGAIALSLLIALALSFLIAHGFSLIHKDRLALLILALFAFTLRLAWVLAVDVRQLSDFAHMYDAALMGARGDFSFSQDPYYSKWAYQMGFTLYQSLILSVFGEGTLVLKLINCFFTTGTVLLVYQTARLLFHEPAGRMAGFLYAIYPPAVIMNAVLTNQHLATFLFYAAFYLMLKNHTRENKWIAAAVGVLFALGQSIRPIAMVVLPCYILYGILRAMLSRQWKGVICVLMTVLTYLAVINGIHQALIASGASPYGLSNRDPLWKFVIGLNDASNGQYSKQDSRYLDHIPLGEERRQMELELIRERIRDKGRLAVLIAKKYYNFMGTKDDAICWGIPTDNYPLAKEVGTFEQVQYILVTLFGLIGSAALFRRHHDKAIFFLLLILMYTGAHMLIEIQTRYREFMYPAIFMLAGYGLAVCYQSLGKGSGSRGKSNLAGQ